MGVEGGVTVASLPAATPRRTDEAALPPPVARYLRLALQGPAAEAPLAVALLQSGTLRTNTSSARWMSFWARHVAAPLGNAFLWNATVRVAPWVASRTTNLSMACCCPGMVKWGGIATAGRRSCGEATWSRSINSM